MNSEQFLKDFGLRRVINAAGTLTLIGAAPVLPELAEPVSAVMQMNVSISELQSRLSDAASRVTGAEAGCVTAGSAAGIVISVAAAMTGFDIHAVERLPDTQGLKNEVVLQAKHDINGGGIGMSQLIRLSGAKVVLTGNSSHTTRYQLEGAISERTCAILHVAECDGGPASLELPEVIRIAHSRNIPVIVDAAGEYELGKYVDMGADLVIYSGHKFLRGTTAGLVVGNRELVRACYLHQTKGIGRAMKVGKEGITGAIAALNARQEQSGLFTEPEVQDRRCDFFIERLNRMNGLNCIKSYSQSGNPVVRTQLTINVQVAGFTAFALVRRLLDGDPIIKFRSYYDLSDTGVVVIDTLYLRDDEPEIIVAAIEQVCLTAHAWTEQERLRTLSVHDSDLEELSVWPD